MATVRGISRRSKGAKDLPPLEPGDHLDQATFHERYEQMPENVKAELIGGVVYMPAAMRFPHGRHHMLLNSWLCDYWAATPGTDALDNATVVLNDDSEPQPDACLRILGGQSREGEDEYVIGAPEFVAEVASSSESYDLHGKRTDYERGGVGEYLILVVRQQRAIWLQRQNDQFIELAPGIDGVLRSLQFPGLWL